MKKKNIKWKFNNIVERFENIEKELLLDKSIIKGVPWWDMVRYPIFNHLVNRLLNQNEIFEKKSIRTIFFLFFQNLKNLFLSFLVKSPFLIKKEINIIWTNPRRKYENGYYVSPYVDEFIDLFPSKNEFAVLESTGIDGHLNPAKTKNLLYAEKLVFLSYLLSYFRLVKLNKNEILLLLKLEEKIFKTFSCKINVTDLAKKNIKRWLGIYSIMHFFLKIKKPKLFFVVASAGLEPIIAAAKSLGIPTLELQHGSPVKGKLNYDYSSGITKYSFPDWYLSFGKFWNTEILPLDKKKIIPLGYPYLNKRLKTLSKIQKENRLVVLSQNDCFVELVQFAIEIKNYFSKKLIVEFKPHPASLNHDFSEHYKNLRNAGVLISDKNADLYKIFSKARWQVGVYSTALYEGLYFGLGCFIYKHKKSILMQKLVEKKLACYVSAAKDINLNWTAKKKDVNKIFNETNQNHINLILSLNKLKKN